MQRKQSLIWIDLVLSSACCLTLNSLSTRLPAVPKRSMSTPFKKHRTSDEFKQKCKWSLKLPSRAFYEIFPKQLLCEHSWSHTCWGPWDNPICTFRFKISSPGWAAASAANDSCSGDSGNVENPCLAKMEPGWEMAFAATWWGCIWCLSGPGLD